MSEGYAWRLGPGEYLVGLLAAAALLGAAIICGRWLRRRLLPGWQGSPAWLATGVLSSATLLLTAQLLGLVGLFNLPVYLLFLIIAAAALSYRPGLLGSQAGIGEARESRGSDPGVGRWLTPLALLVAGVVVLRALWTVAGSFDGGMGGFDTHWYHGPFTALFLQSGDTFALNNSIAPQYLSWFYPHNSELWHAIAVLPFDRDLLSPALNLVWLIGTMLAAWCIGRPFGVEPLSLIGASLILGAGLLADQPGEMRNDIPAVFFVLAAAAIAVNAWGRGTEIGLSRGALAVIGLAAGLAAGTKLNYLATAGALVVALALTLPAGRRLRAFGTLFGAAFLGGGYWYLRNLVHSGNPLPWVTSVGPIDLPAPSQEIGGRETHGVIEYLLDIDVWREWFLPGLRETLTLAWPLILLAALVSTLALVLPALVRRQASRARDRGDDDESAQRYRWPAADDRWVRPKLALAATIMATLVAWLIAPASAEGPAGAPVGFVSGLRYLAPALVLALALFPVAVRPLFGARLIGARGRYRREPGDLAVATGVRGEPGQPLERPRGVSSRRWWAALTAVAVAVAFAGFVGQRAYLDGRYANPDFSTPGLNQAFADASRAAPKADGAPPVAVSSTRMYAFFGPDLQQPVAYVGIAEPHGGFRRPETCREWRQAVNESEAEQLIVAWDRLSPEQPPLPPEAAWIAADPASTKISSGGGAVTFEIEGELDPTTCR